MDHHPIRSLSTKIDADVGNVETIGEQDEKMLSSSSSSTTQQHIFSDPVVAEYWSTIYEKAKYENRHRFDPSFSWTVEEERRLVRKIDWRIMLWGWIMFCALDLPRKNVNQAITDDMLPELGMNTNDNNYGRTIFLASFLAAELPSGLISKWMGADRWIPILIVSWSIVAACQVWLTNRAGFFACRALLGLLMGGFIPDIVLWLTYFYTSKDLLFRFAILWTAVDFISVLSSLLAAGILQMRGVGGWSGWQWLFMLEGILTSIIGVLSWFLMPPGPCQTKGRLRGKKGWFTDREEYIIVNRLLRDDPSRGDMNNRQPVGPKLLWKALKDWEQWPLYMIGIIAYLPPAPPQNYLSFILRQMGFSTFNANLLAIPSQFMNVVNLLLIAWISRRYNEKAIIGSMGPVWLLPFFIALVVLGSSASPWVRYGLLTGLLSYPWTHFMLVAWNAQNSNAVRTRAVSAALYNMCVQTGNIISANLYTDDDRPYYNRGNRILLAITCASIALFWGTKVFYIWRNRVRERKWNAMSKQEQEDYLLHTTDEGQQRLDFRFSH